VSLPAKDIVQLAVASHPKLAEATKIASTLEKVASPTKQMTESDLHVEAGKNAMKDIKEFLMLKEVERKKKNHEIRQKKGMFAAMDHLMNDDGK